MSNQSNRKEERAALDLYINKIVGDEPHMVLVRDISPSGVFLYKLIEPDHAGSGEVGLELMLPDSEEVIWAVGEVVRNERGEGHGLRFTRLSEADRRRIETYVARAGADSAAA